MSEIDVVALLAEWGQWSRVGKTSLKAKSSMLFVMELVQPAGCKSLNICDQDALRVDRAVASLKKYDARLFLVVELYFLDGLSMREIEGRLKLSKTEANKIFARACGWLECKLDVKSEVA